MVPKISSPYGMRGLCGYENARSLVLTVLSLTDVMRVCFPISRGLTIRTQRQEHQYTLHPVHLEAVLEEHPRCHPRSGRAL